MKQLTEQEALEALKGMGATVGKNGSLTHPTVLFEEPTFTDEGMPLLKSLPRLYALNLSQTFVTDAALSNLEGLTSLEELGLGKQITDAGLVHLRGLTSLRNLTLNYSQVSDAGLAELKSLTNLDHLGLAACKNVNGSGLRYLAGLTRLEYINLSGSGVTDAALEHLKVFPNLRIVGLIQTQISPAALESIQRAMPNCSFD